MLADIQICTATEGDSHLSNTRPEIVTLLIIAAVIAWLMFYYLLYLQKAG